MIVYIDKKEKMAFRDKIYNELEATELAVSDSSIFPIVLGDDLQPLDLALKVDAKKKISLSLEYLSNTDWYYSRKIETGEDVPAEVSTKRVEARDFLRSQGY